MIKHKLCKDKCLYPHFCMCEAKAEEDLPVHYLEMSDEDFLKIKDKFACVQYEKNFDNLRDYHIKRINLRNILKDD